MAFTFFKSVSIDGGGRGVQFYDSVKGTLFPKVEKSEKVTGIIYHRKIYIGTDIDTLFDLGLNSEGLWSTCIFPSTGDAEVVGDITGSEPKNGAGVINKVEDTVGSVETVNGAGGLIDLKIFYILKDVETSDEYFRAGEKIVVNGSIYTIDTVEDDTTTWKVTVTAEGTYAEVIGKTGYSMMQETANIGLYVPYWIKVTVPPNADTDLQYNTFGINTRS